MSRLKPTPIKSYLHIHLTNKTKTIVSILIGWIALTTFLVWLGIQSNLFHKQYECKIDTEIPTAQQQEDKLAKKIQEVYNVSRTKAIRVASLATMHTIPGEYPKPELLVALFWVESRFNENAVSSAGAKGIAQIMPFNSTGSDSVSNVYDSVRILREYRNRIGDHTKTLMAYNIGISPVLAGKARNYKYAEDINKELEKLEKI